MEKSDSIKIEQFKSIEDFRLSSEQQSAVQRSEANNEPNNYYGLNSPLSIKGVLLCLVSSTAPHLSHGRSAEPLYLSNTRVIEYSGDLKMTGNS